MERWQKAEQEVSRVGVVGRMGAERGSWWLFLWLLMACGTPDEMNALLLRARPDDGSKTMVLAFLPLDQG